MENLKEQYKLLLADTSDEGRVRLSEFIEANMEGLVAEGLVGALEKAVSAEPAGDSATTEA